MLKHVIRATANAALATPGVHRLARHAGRRGLLPERLWSGVPLERVVDLEAAGVGFRYHLSPGDYVGMPLYWLGGRGYEPETMDHLPQFLAGASCFYDIGANTGLFSLLAAKLEPRLRVVAIEPNPATFARLSEHIALNRLDDRVTAHAAAIGVVDGPVTLHIPAGTHALSSTLAPEGAADTLPGHRPVSVHGATMRSMLAAFPIPGAIKIDAEGFEAAILESMADFLAQHRPRLLIEVLDDAPIARLNAALAPGGYRCARLGHGPMTWRDRIGPREAAEGRNVVCMAQ